MPRADWACTLMHPNPESRLNSIDQLGTYSQVSRITKAWRWGCTGGWGCVMCVQDSRVGMELLALKHEWLFHGPVTMPCPCLSKQEEKGWSFCSDRNFCSSTSQQKTVSLHQMQLVQVCWICANATQSSHLVLWQSLRSIFLPASCNLTWPDFYSAMVSLPL